MRTPFGLPLALFALTGLGDFVRADELQTTVVATQSSGESEVVTVDLKWKFSWRDERNHDAVWLVVRSREAGLHRLAKEGHRVLSANRPVEIHVSEDGVGAFIEPARDGSGTLEIRVDLELLNDTANKLEVWALEMVAIPAGAFEVGDDAPAVIATGALHRVGKAGQSAGAFEVQSEAQLALSAKPGSLWYGDESHNAYQGDQLGPIPAEFPKGTAAFYVMKYELTQGQYARFLDALPEPARAERAIHELEGDGTESISIELVDKRFVASAPDRPCNFVSWDDSSAYADWMGLRPMTELEFEKAARGPSRPVPADFPWGTATIAGVERVVLPTRDLAVGIEQVEQLLDDDRRIALAASHYRVMDLSGSLWERVITIGHPKGRAFRGTHGDGQLDPSGRATNADWPFLGEDGRIAFGIGYRGGAEYFAAQPDVTNPFSCVATRTYAGWEGAFRSKTYSARAVRTAP